MPPPADSDDVPEHPYEGEAEISRFKGIGAPQREEKESCAWI